MRLTSGKSRSPTWPAAVICCIAGLVYLAAFGLGAVVNADTESYARFVVMRPLGYPIALWVCERLGLTSYLGMLQLAAMFGAYLTLWRSVQDYLSRPWAWFVLIACLANVELVKYAFRENPEALFTAALAWHLASLIGILAGKRKRAMIALVISGAALIWIRPVGVPILLATVFALAAYASPAVTVRAVAGLVALGWLAPTLANGLTRGVYAPQMYGGFHAIVPVSHAVMTVDSARLAPPLDGLAADLAPLKEAYGKPAWPFELAIMQALVSPYLTLTLTPEFQAEDYEALADDPASLAKLDEASARGRSLFRAVLTMLPGPYLEATSANVIGLLTAPGFIDPVTKAAIAARLDRAAAMDSELSVQMREALDAQRVIPVWALGVLRLLGVLTLTAALAAGFRLAFDLIARFVGSVPAGGLGALVASLGTMITGYVLMAGLVAAIPRFTLVVFPLLALFVAAVFSLAAGRR